MREAIAHAIDNDLLNERIFEGHADAVTTLFPEDSPLYPGFEGPEYDPDLAAQKVEEAKANGWDGTVSLLTNDDQIQVEIGIAVEAMLEAVGMDVNLESLPTPARNERVFTNPNFQILLWGMGAPETAPWERVNSFASTSPRTRSGYGSPEMDAALVEMSQATTVEERQAALAEFQEVWNRDVASVFMLDVQWFFTVGERIHGLTYNRDMNANFDTAYIEE